MNCDDAGIRVLNHRYQKTLDEVRKSSAIPLASRKEPNSPSVDSGSSKTPKNLYARRYFCNGG
jgi:hypothetical protein